MDTRSSKVAIVFTLVMVIMVEEASAHWWSLASPRAHLTNMTAYRTEMCDADGVFSRNQKALCKRYHNHMEFVREGALNGIGECQHQFSDHRWNCSTVKDNSVFGNVLDIGSKEIAFAYAVASAGVVHAVTKACQTGHLECGCTTKPRPKGLQPDWSWEGCREDTSYAYGFAQEFIDAHERDNLSPRGRKAKARKAMNLHNNEAGRMTVVRSARPACKCHGVSGSCNMKSCWNRLPDFRSIGQVLRQAHIDSVDMRITKKGQIKVRRPSRHGSSKADLTDLVYIEASPDYCHKNIRTGVPGTRGRECDKKSRGVDGCGLLCCGRGYSKKKVVIYKECNCKFQWCCTVKCETCKEEITKHICH